MSPTETLEKYFPAAAVPKILNTIQREGIKIKFLPAKKSFVGRYECKRDEFSVPVIKICDLGGKWNHLFTFVHELAHHFVWQKTKVNHGHDIVWQNYFQTIIGNWLDFFPKEIGDKIFDEFMMGHISATGCEVQGVLDKYDFPDRKTENRIFDGLVSVAELPIGAFFECGGKYFEKSYLMRKNFTCYQLPWREKWRFGPNCRVRKVNESDIPKTKVTVREMEFGEGGGLVLKQTHEVEI